MKLGVLDLFCGAGGFSLGFQMAGFNIIGGVDCNEDAIRTYNRNFNRDGVLADITQLTSEEIVNIWGGKVDILIGGSPCQGFSVANVHKKENDPRNMLFNEIIRFAKILNPKIILMENVRQILTVNNGEIYNTIKQQFTELGYNVNYKKVNAKDFGVPQSRNRVIIIAYKTTLPSIDLKLLQSNREPTTVKEALAELYPLEHEYGKGWLSSTPVTPYQIYLRDTDNMIYNHEIVYPNEKVQKRMEHIPQDGNWKNVPKELWDNPRDNMHSSAYKRLDESKQSVTITTGHASFFHPIYNRWLTVRESARLQSFPDWFIFNGGKTSCLRQVGNAVPPLLAKSIAEFIKSKIKN